MIKFCNLCSYPLVRINKTVFGLRCLGCKSTFIHRAMGEVLKNAPINNDAKVHEFSCHGSVFKYLNKRFKNLSWSEYYDDVKPGEFKNNIQCQDLQNLTLESNTYDLMTSTEVFEHVPDDIKGFREVYRCLKKGGYHIFSVPLYETDKTTERAKIVNGKLEHYLEPEYHGDHLRNKGILAFRNYGLDITDRLKSVGFEHVEIKRLFNDKLGINPTKQVIVAQK